MSEGVNGLFNFPAYLLSKVHGLTPLLFDIPTVPALNPNSCLLTLLSRKIQLLEGQLSFG